MATTSSISGGGIDVDAIVNGLMTIERLPLDQLTKKQTSYQSKITALGTLQSKVDALQTAAKNLGSSSTSSLTSFKTTSSDSSILSATAGSIRMLDKNLSEHRSELARQMKPGEEPRPKKVTTVGKTWGYGNLPPELE